MSKMEIFTSLTTYSMAAITMVILAMTYFPLVEGLTCLSMPGERLFNFQIQMSTCTNEVDKDRMKVTACYRAQRERTETKKQGFGFTSSYDNKTIYGCLYDNQKDKDILAKFDAKKPAKYISCMDSAGLENMSSTFLTSSGTNVTISYGRYCKCSFEDKCNRYSEYHSSGITTTTSSNFFILSSVVLALGIFLLFPHSPLSST